MIKLTPELADRTMCKLAARDIHGNGPPTVFNQEERELLIYSLQMLCQQYRSFVTSEADQQMPAKKPE